MSNKPGKYQPWALSVHVRKDKVVSFEYCGDHKLFETPDQVLKHLRHVFEDQDGVDMLFYDIYNQCGFRYIDPLLKDMI